MSKGWLSTAQVYFEQQKVIISVLQEDRVIDTKDHCPISQETGIECALGVHACMESDTPVQNHQAR